MPYVSRDVHGEITGIYAQPQPGLADEFVESAAPPLRRRDFETAIEAHLDAIARDKGYYSGARLAGYVSSTVQQWANEAQAFIAWRDAVWVYALTELAKVEAGQRTKPEEVADFIAELPAMDWPS